MSNVFHLSFYSPLVVFKLATVHTEHDQGVSKIEAGAPWPLRTYINISSIAIRMVGMGSVDVEKTFFPISQKGKVNS